jgi:GNAT superfamily N-acetyltransferase
MELESARPEQIEELHAILEACGLDMQARLGLAHWVPAYPLELMQQDAESSSVYAVRQGQRAIATFTIHSQAPGYYDLSIWQQPEAKALYVHRLAVLPAHQGQGIGRWCMDQVIQLARIGEYRAVRLDAYDKHLALHAFYRHLGYQERGAFRLVTQRYGETGGVYFEKVLPEHL